MSKGEGFGDVPDPFGKIDSVDTTYQPPRNLSAWEPERAVSSEAHATGSSASSLRPVSDDPSLLPSMGDPIVASIQKPNSGSLSGVIGSMFKSSDTSTAGGSKDPNDGMFAMADSQTPSEFLLGEEEPFTVAHLSETGHAKSSRQISVSGFGTQRTDPSSVAVQPPLPFTAGIPPSETTGKIGSSKDAKKVSRDRSQELNSEDHRSNLLSSANGSRIQSSSGQGAQLEGSAAAGPGGLPYEDFSSYSMFSIKRYREYFNVDTEDVLYRIYRSIIFFFRGDFVEHAGANPDLWGPFWIASTLVFVSAAAGNTASYIAYQRSNSGSSVSPSQGGESAPAWYYDVDKVGGSMGLFYGYVSVLGLLLWAILKWCGSNVSLPSVWCIYGYAMAAFIPMAALCVIPLESVRWSLVMAATAISGTFLTLNLRRPLLDSTGAKGMPLLLGVVGLHAVLGLSLKLYFFHYSNS